MAVIRKQVRKTPTSRSPLVPSMNIARDYVSRKVEGGITDFKMLEHALANGRNVLIEGPTGCGKTMFLEAFAAKKRMRFGFVNCNVGVEPSQFFGRIVPTTDGTFEWVDGIVTDFVKNGGLLLFNEINFLPDKISTALFSLFDHRREIMLLDKGNELVRAGQKPLLLAADCNPDYLGTRPLNAAFRNRFSIKSVWDYDEKVETALVGCKPLIDFAGQIRVSPEVETPVSTNMLVEFVDHWLDISPSFAVECFVNTFAIDERKPIHTMWQAVEKNVAAILDQFELSEEADDDDLIPISSAGGSDGYNYSQ